MVEKPQQFHEPIENRKGTLYFDGVSAKKLAEKFDTPLYVISENRIRENYSRLRTALSSNYEKVRIYYAAKANSNLTVLKILETEGAYLDAVSPGEVFLALKTGFPPERILFTGTSVRDDELRFLADSSIPVNIDSISQLDRLLKVFVPQILSVRVNPEIGAGHHDHCITAGKNTKFGLWEKTVLEAYKKAKKAGVAHFGIQMHIGSGGLDINPFILALNRLLSVAKKVHNAIGIDFEFIDMGGGLGVPYKPEDKELDLALFSKEVLSLFKSKIDEYDLGRPFFCVEPGRYLVCDASILLTKVNTLKITPFKKFVGVDAGFNTLLRPAMYGSFHQILVASNLESPDQETYDVVGPICESGDVLAKDRLLPEIQEGDLLAVQNSGAYGYSMSSQYNSRPRAAEVLVKNGKCALIRAREKLSDLLSGQRMAES
jgi:diaminopimelate decarboxylase